MKILTWAYKCICVAAVAEVAFLAYSPHTITYPVSVLGEAPASNPRFVVLFLFGFAAFVFAAFNALYHQSERNRWPWVED